MDFTRRSKDSELMDEPNLARDELEPCLRDLAHVNRVTLGYRPTLQYLERIRHKVPAERGLRVLDVGCGYGDTLRAVSDWARRRNVRVSLTGLDISEVTIDIARRATDARHDIRWVTQDALSHAPEERPDVVLSSLFTHHLDDDRVAQFLRWMDQTASLGWFVNDLHRHRAAYHSFRWLSRAFGWHRMVRHDGPLSVARAFTHEDWARLLAKTRIEPSQARIEWWMPFRLCVSKAVAP